MTSNCSGTCMLVFFFERGCRKVANQLDKCSSSDQVYTRFDL